MRLVAIVAAVIFKLWLAYRIMSADDWHKIIIYISFFLLGAVLLGIVTREKEESKVREIYCNDPSQPTLENYCEYKLRNASSI